MTDQITITKGELLSLARALHGNEEAITAISQWLVPWGWDFEFFTEAGLGHLVALASVKTGSVTDYVEPVAPVAKKDDQP